MPVTTRSGYNAQSRVPTSFSDTNKDPTLPRNSARAKRVDDRARWLDSPAYCTPAPLLPTSEAQAEPTHPPPVFSPAAKKVFHINELFEEILLGLDMKTLLLSQRVSIHWRGSITGSKLLQKKLFMLPATLEELPRLNLVEEGTFVVDLEREGARPLALLKNAPKTHNVTRTLMGDVVVHNHLLLERPIRGSLDTDKLQMRHIATGEYKSYHKSSWLRMLLLQPPPDMSLHMVMKGGWRCYTDSYRGSLGGYITVAKRAGAKGFHGGQHHLIVLPNRDLWVNALLISYATPVATEDLAVMGLGVAKN